MCPRGDPQLTSMAPIALTTEFAYKSGVDDDGSDWTIRWSTAVA
jgi:hypothetical protein